ncbi:hypothetical protein JKA74_03075 [Marivirga sp. S37H4]|uniref:Lipoprotein n=1 Tax=Marivirga aurantiaca TaxID=2802615 RepID=A0A934WW32_9BACT|nr:hypothetical protein [Marivirga aurantiaca]MBK6264007.1 hypothetical protein [Marivirga aurantiaca]
MNYIKSILTVTLLSALLFSCSEKKEENKETHNKLDQQNEKNKIELENGERWIVNDEMKPFLNKSEAILQSYTSSNDTNHLELAGQLKEQNDQLISSCTMKGKSHDELHKWLHPHLQLVKALQNAGTEKEAEAIINQLEESYNIYHQYFQ